MSEEVNNNETNQSEVKEVVKTTKNNPLGVADNTYLMLIHLSQLLNIIIPPGGLIAPIVLWMMKKDEDEQVDIHGRNAVNFAISLVAYSIVATILTFVLIGIFVFILIGIIAVVFPIIAGIKANKGEVWKYPLTIDFLGMFGGKKS